MYPIETVNWNGKCVCVCAWHSTTLVAEMLHWPALHLEIHMLLHSLQLEREKSLRNYKYSCSYHKLSQYVALSL